MKSIQSARSLVPAVLSICMSSAAIGQQQADHYAVIDRGLSLIRTLLNTPGLNSYGDLAVWRLPSTGPIQGALYRGQQTLELSGSSSFPLVFPADLNDNLTVVGVIQAVQDLRFTQAAEWAGDKLVTLPGIGGKYSAANAINRSGDVVGSGDTMNGSRHAVLWQGERANDLGLLEKGGYSVARDINDQGDIVGEANATPGGKPQAVAWRAGHIQKLSTLTGGSFCSAQAINNLEEIAGSCDLPGGSAHAVIWKHRTITDLGTLGGTDATSTALDINAKSQVVGSSEIVDGKLRAFLWQNGKIYDLNQAIAPEAGWLLLVASRINDRGEIAGRGYFHGAIHAFILVPKQM